MTYDDFLVSNLLWVNVVLALVAGTLAWQISKRLPRGWIAGIVGALVVLIIAVLLSALNVLAWLVAWGGARAFEPLAAHLGGGIAFFLESGLEFGLLGIVTSLIVYVVGRWKSRRGAPA